MLDAVSNHSFYSLEDEVTPEEDDNADYITKKILTESKHVTLFILAAMNNTEKCSSKSR